MLVILEELAWKNGEKTADAKKWAAFFRKETRKGKDIYCYFDNDQTGYTPLKAKTMRSLL